MTVVSNMSPLHYLILINCEHILPLLYGQVFTPPAVIEEMRAPITPEVVRRWIDSPPEWLKIVEPADIEDIPRLGQGKRVLRGIVWVTSWVNKLDRHCFPGRIADSTPSQTCHALDPARKTRNLLLLERIQ
jgi:hypothetical protein